MKKASAKVFGFEPDQMCEVLQLGLDFWANQKKNESIKHTQDMKNIRKHLSELEKQNAKMLKVGRRSVFKLMPLFDLEKESNPCLKLTQALEDERLKKKSLQSEKESLQRTVSELETRYAEKSR